ncbi:hypothetical protein [Ralstonia pickettii]|uniref:hypothetical protein n=1 Tax=Ralstonia pickettii TaxID=329 RepID=UPI0015B7B351|nr:hypothetical protein [Ralstonia pickettii]NWK46447.1 hypothetical protein [Ralstonia pickettii]
MLSRIDLEANFSDVKALGGGIFSCKDVLPKRAIHYYLRFGEQSANQADLLLVSENLEDSGFAAAVLSSAPTTLNGQGLAIATLAQNAYGFSRLVLTPASFHGYFKGRRDDKRGNLLWCIPAHACEFSGNETAAEFSVLRREIVETENWHRGPAPKLVLRFDNPRTGSGTGSAQMFATLDTLYREIELLDGAPTGFLELINYKGEVIELLSPVAGQYTLILGRDDSTRRKIDKNDLRDFVWEFLTQ